MAWQLRYTSAPAGATGRSGFQYVSDLTDVPPEVVRVVTPYMVYRPPPDASVAPSDAEMADFPVTMAYGRSGEYAIVARCHYTGRDYSGRHGNFVGQALVATADEMEGLHPIELWSSPAWEKPGDLTPGTTFDPEALVGRPDARLGPLLEAVAGALGGGRVTLVSARAEVIAEWIAVVSYSFPAHLAAQLTFTTYTDEPETAPQLIVGTVPAARPDGGTVFDLDGPPGEASSGRFGSVIAACWQSGDFDGIDAIGELAGDGLLDRLNTAAALVALCRGTPVSASEEAVAAELLRERRPDWVWPAIAPMLPRIGYELSALLADVAPEAAERCVMLALHGDRSEPPPVRLRDGMPGEFRAAVAAAEDLGALARIVRLAVAVGGAVEPGDVLASAAACARRGSGDIAEALNDLPEAWREPLTNGVLAGLEASEPAVREAMLTRKACAALGGDRDWRNTPRTGSLVLVAGADRAGATVRLLALEPYDLADLLAGLWERAPGTHECERLAERLGDEMARFDTLRGLPLRVFESAPLIESARLAGLVRDWLPGPATIVLNHAAAVGAADAGDVARLLGEFDLGDEQARRAVDSVAEALAGQPPAFRADVLRETSGPARDRLAEGWTGAELDREGRTELAEVAVREPHPRLAEWARGLGRMAARQVEAGLGEYAAGWRDLRRRRT